MSSWRCARRGARPVWRSAWTESAHPSRLTGRAASAPPGQPFGIGQVKPPDLLLAVVGKPGEPAAAIVPAEAGDEIAPNDRASVEPDEAFRIELFLELADPMIDQPAAPADV